MHYKLYLEYDGEGRLRKSEECSPKPPYGLGKVNYILQSYGYIIRRGESNF